MDFRGHMLKSVLVIAVLFLPIFLTSADFSDPKRWFAYDDSSEPNNGSSKISIEAENNSDGFYITAKGSVTKKFQYGFAGFGVNPSSVELANIKRAKGFKFKIKSDGRAYRVRVQTSNVKDYNYYGKIFVTKPGRLIEVQVLYSELEQESWGNKVQFNRNKITMITFQTIDQPIASFVITITGLELIM